MDSSLRTPAVSVRPGTAVSPTGVALFSGPHSLRVPSENGSLWLCLLSAPLTIALIGLIFHSVSVSEFALLIVGGMVYVSISRGRLLGSSVRIHARQFPEVHAIVEETAARLGINPPQIFARDDVFVPIAAVGTGEPYALIISSQYLEHLRPDELRFLIARECAHIAAGHTRISSLLTASGRENPAVALVFGAWLRKTEYTAERVGLLCTPQFKDAISAISITSFHTFGRRVDMSVLAEQRRELEAEPSLRLGEWISATPYATNRIAALAFFAESPLAHAWRQDLAKPRVLEVEVDETTPPDHVSRRDCAPNTRRAMAVGIDLLVVGLIMKTAQAGIEVDRTSKMGSAARGTESLAVALPLMPGQALAHWLAAHGMAMSFSDSTTTTLLGFWLYSAILVGLTGQTLGMMVAELRVVTNHFGRVGPVRAAWRYAIATLMLLAMPVAFSGFFMRVHIHDRFSRTRVVSSRTLSALSRKRA